MHQIIKLDNSSVQAAVSVLNAGDLVAFPTETVYGLGGNAYNDDVIEKIYKYKGRPQFNPLIVHYDTIERAMDDVEFTENALKIANKFMPGPVTLLLKRKRSSKLSTNATAGLDTVGVRIPNNDIARFLLSNLSFPLAAPSANKSTKLSPTTAQAVSESLCENENLMIIDGGRCGIGIESTIIDATTNDIKILRYGFICAQDIYNECGINVVDSNTTGITCPGQMLKHYSPQKQLYINANTADKDSALLAYGVPFENMCKHVLNLSETRNLSEAAANLFYMLRELDKTDARSIFVMPIPNIGIGIAINDKLKRGAFDISDMDNLLKK